MSQCQQRLIEVNVTSTHKRWHFIPEPSSTSEEKGPMWVHRVNGGLTGRNRDNGRQTAAEHRDNGRLSWQWIVSVED
ncbi:hypothetical protein PoB_000135500 [Plakobranchus ocellatus]|uniref:Uncharacterized protein n=1 Tax=Plakobranchus ocellatus TaxID=259542 RepID=A0AAV3XW59_9GAST|nr:hypothetical protein PoB_000135500 [Plakobranchus ocellatus]